MRLEKHIEIKSSMNDNFILDFFFKYSNDFEAVVKTSETVKKVSVST